MSFFDRFRRSRPAPAPPDPPATGGPAPGPGPARIISLSADAVGTLETDQGVTLRFGSSACAGFEPVVGARVIVEAVGPHPLGGWRATHLTLDPSSVADYDARVAEQDAARGVARTSPLEQATATTLTLGWIGVLLHQPPPSGPAAQQAWAQGFPLAARGIQVATGGQLGFRVPAAGRWIDVITYVGQGPFDAHKLDLRGMDPGLDLGRGFLGLSLGLPGMQRTLHTAMGSLADPWAEDGGARALSRLVTALLEGGTAVVLPLAGAIAVERDRFLAMLGDLEDTECRPFGAFITDAIDNERQRHLTLGMGVFGLPDVAVPTSTDPWQRARRFEALMLACHRMVRENRELAAGEVLEVPIGLSAGAWPIESPPATDGATAPDAQRYTVTLDEQTVLVPLEPAVDPAACWARASDPAHPDPALIGLRTYQAYRDLQLQAVLGAMRVVQVGYTTSDRVPHAIEVHALPEGGFLIATSGLGRLAQAGGREVGAAHVEVGTFLDDHSFEWVSLVGQLSSALHTPGADPWKPHDTLRAPIDELGVAGFALADGGTLLLPPGAPVGLLVLVPLDGAEYEDVRGGGCADWVAAQLGDPPRPEAVRARWRSFLPASA
jgi:hypothetical protein